MKNDMIKRFIKYSQKFQPANIVIFPEKTAKAEAKCEFYPNGRYFGTGFGDRRTPEINCRQDFYDLITPAKGRTEPWLSVN